MPMGNTMLWIAAGVTAATGAFAVFYIRKKQAIGGHQETRMLKADQSQLGAPPRASSTRGLIISGLKKLTRERKMVFVVNRPLLSNKQILFVSVSTACLHYYRSVAKNRDYYKTHVKPWTRLGQMKVVLKANSSDELTAILEKCRSENVEALLLNIADLKLKPTDETDNVGEKKKGKKNDNLSLADQDPATPVILCCLAPTDKLDSITGHLKLL